MVGTLRFASLRPADHRDVMSGLNDAFDRTGRVRRPPSRFLLREVCAGLTYFRRLPDCSALPPGRDRVVLVIPGFLTTNLVTRRLRRFLQRCGYRPFGWGLGLNWGPTPQLSAALRQRLLALRALAGDRVSVVGVSLGGLMARDLAYDHPDDVRDVITLASPYALPTASTLEPLLRLAARFFDPAADIARMAAPLPIPSVAIFTRDDGLVAWESCRREEENCRLVEVTGSHLTIYRNPDALRAVAAGLGT
jgi:pimeloyl-ACP methyl ester carboxylesterase